MQPSGKTLADKEAPNQGDAYDFIYFDLFFANF